MALPYTYAEDRDPAVGVIVLQTDELVELDLGRVFTQHSVRQYVSRIPAMARVTPSTLATMGDHMTHSAELLPIGADIAAIAYGCTSGATVLGETRVTDLVHAAHPNAKVTNPMTALKAACRALGVSRLAMVTPYEPSVSDALITTLRNDGIETVDLTSFEQSEDAKVARIAPASILDAIINAGGQDCDAVFASCTNLRAYEVITEAERILGKPVMCSNQVMAWHMLTFLGISLKSPSNGQLFDVATNS